MSCINEDEAKNIEDRLSDLEKTPDQLGSPNGPGFYRYRPGGTYLAPGFADRRNTWQDVQASGYMLAVAWEFVQEYTADTFVVNTEASVGSGTTLHLGIYDSENAYPKNRILYLTSTGSGTWIQDFTFPPDLYWFLWMQVGPNRTRYRWIGHSARASSTAGPIPCVGGGDDIFQTSYTHLLLTDQTEMPAVAPSGMLPNFIDGIQLQASPGIPEIRIKP